MGLLLILFAPAGLFQMNTTLRL